MDPETIEQGIITREESTLEILERLAVDLTHSAEDNLPVRSEKDRKVEQLKMLRTLVKQRRFIRRLSEEPTIIVPVCKITQSTQKTEFINGSRVRIASSETRPDLIGQTGQIISDPHEDQKFIVIIDDSEEIGLFSTSEKEQELELLDTPSRSAIILHHGAEMEIKLPLEMRVKPGQRIKLNAKTSQAIDIAIESPENGEVATVIRVIDESRSEVNFRGEHRIVLNTKANNLSAGDRVMLDSSGYIVLSNLGKQDNRFKYSLETNTTFEDIVGLEEIKEELLDIVDGHTQPKGVLLWGAPRCGKTLLMKALGGALRTKHGQEKISSGVYYLKGPEILEELVGRAESTIRQLFAMGREHKKRHGFPAIIIFDEAESICRKRGTSISSDILDSIVPTLLAEMDGLEPSDSIVFMLTNRQDLLDPAIVADGRIDIKLRVPRPTKESFEEILRRKRLGIKIQSGDAQRLAHSAVEKLYSPSLAFLEITRKATGDTPIEAIPFTLAQIANGAMAVNIVTKAETYAKRSARKNQKEYQGITEDDILRAVQNTYTENMGLDHEDALIEFTHDFAERILSIKPLKQLR